MSDNLNDNNHRIRQEADSILNEQGLLSILKSFGIPHVTGSYALNLMTWRDLDIYLESENISEEDFFKLGASINNRFSPVRMSYRNERINKSEGLPEGLYWGVYLGDERKGAWKVDIWAMDAKQCKERLKFCNDIEAKLTDESRQIILSIKSQCWQDAAYRKLYSSNDIYKAVLKEGIKDMEGFREYLKNRGT